MPNAMRMRSFGAPPDPNEGMRINALHGHPIACIGGAVCSQSNISLWQINNYALSILCSFVHVADSHT